MKKIRNWVVIAFLLLLFSGICIFIEPFVFRSFFITQILFWKFIWVIIACISLGSIFPLIIATFYQEELLEAKEKIEKLKNPTKKWFYVSALLKTGANKRDHFFGTEEELLKSNLLKTILLDPQPAIQIYEFGSNGQMKLVKDLFLKLLENAEKK